MNQLSLPRWHPKWPFISLCPALSLEPEQNPSAPWNQTKAKCWLLAVSMGREWLKGALSGGSCTEFLRVGTCDPNLHSMVWYVLFGWLSPMQSWAGSDLAKLHIHVFKNSPAHPSTETRIESFPLRCLKPNHYSLGKCLTARRVRLPKEKSGLFSLSKQN